MKVVFFGASKFVIPLIDMLHTSFDLRLVITTERDPSDTIPNYCKKNDILFSSVKTLDEKAVEQIKAIHADVAVLAYFGVLLPQKVLTLFPHGILNIHPSLLPQYRGATPVQSALLNGDTITGVSIIKLDALMDHGPLLAQVHETIHTSDTKESLHDRLFTKGTQMLKNLLPDYVNGTIKLQEQDHDKATFTARSLTKQDGYIEATNPPDAVTLDRMIRAYYPWPGAWARLRFVASDGQAKEKIVKLLPASSLRGMSETSDEAISSQYLLQVEGKKPMSIKDFANGYPQAREQVNKLFSQK